MKRTAQIVIAVAGLLCASGLAFAQDAITQPAQKTVGAHTMTVEARRRTRRGSSATIATNPIASALQAPRLNVK